MHRILDRIRVQMVVAEVPVNQVSLLQPQQVVQSRIDFANFQQKRVVSDVASQKSEGE